MIVPRLEAPVPPQAPRRMECVHVGCRDRSVVRCDYPLDGPARGRRCGSPLCGRHAHLAPNGDRYCAPHARRAGLLVQR